MGSKMLFVTNKNPFVHRDRYDGEDFTFPPNEEVAVSEEAAEHMFGRGLKDKTSTLQRLGWAFEFNPQTKTFADSAIGARQLANFVFNEAKLTPMLHRETEPRELEIA